MEVGHASCYVLCKGEPEAPVQWDIIVLQHVIQTSLGTVLRDDAEVCSLLDCGSDEPAEVRVVQFPVRKQQQGFKLTPVY